MLPSPAPDPPFNITRMSHVVLTVRDLDASLAFYTEVVGLVVSARDADGAWLRGLEEAAHHSLILRVSRGEPVCKRVGYRVRGEDDLDRAKEFFDRTGLPATWSRHLYQRRALHVSDHAGTPIELVAHMDTCPRLLTRFDLWRGGHAQRLDHVQIQVPDVPAAAGYYAALGFRISEYMAIGEELIGAFMFRKGDTQDVVFLPGAGPRLHHFAYTVQESRDLFAVCDAAGRAGMGDKVERGPGRHGPSAALFVYLRDPDGHRVELFCNHYQIIDTEIEPIRWDAKEQSLLLQWGLPAQRRWFAEATNFASVAPIEPEHPGAWNTLEKYLAGPD